ncbi:FIG146805: Plasmid related protein [plant metagenome]|uniref:FIG146805: Plasmid related protein n=1 Tax=plant metagenome TaxID=1297885 RepID=A0A484QW67_9ZZZZ
MATQALFLSLVPSVRFSPGATVMTTGVADLVQQGRLNPSPYLRRHLGGDWGDLDESDRRQNDAALASGEDRLFSSYQVDPDLKLWIITEWDRSVTTLLLPSEY